MTENNAEKIKELIPDSWKKALLPVTETKQFEELCDFILREYKEHTVYPAKENIFNSIKNVNPEDVKVVIIGQDPYHEPNQAHGLSFSVMDGVEKPKSLINIFKELSDDVGCKIPESGNLTAWANRGVLLLNTVLTVRAHEANSHKDKGWESVTREIIRTVLEQPQPKVFILWGKQAENTFFSVYDKTQHKNVMFLKSAHPSPLSAYRGFFGSKPFSKTNNYLQRHGSTPINWSI